MLSFFKFLCLFYLVHLVAAQCRDGWTAHAERCFKFVSDFTEDWVAAEGYCKFFAGGSLAEIQNAADHAFIVGEIKKLGGAFYVGGSDIEHEGVWRWMGSDVTTNQTGYTNWMPGQPDNLNSRHHHENCLVLDPGYKYLWNDIECTAAEKFICEGPMQDTGAGIVG